MMTFMHGSTSLATTSRAFSALAPRQSTDGFATVNLHPRKSDAPDASHGQTSMGSSAVVQRDLTWVELATADEIDRALEAGELEQLLGSGSKRR